MFHVAFYPVGDDDASLFTAHLKAVPRVGELVSYSFEPHDREKWNQDSLDAGDRAGKLVNRWKVVEVAHLIRRLSVMSEPSQVICVMLEPAP